MTEKMGGHILIHSAAIISTGRAQEKQKFQFAFFTTEDTEEHS
jgi:hypothetical protein